MRSLRALRNSLIGDIDFVVSRDRKSLPDRLIWLEIMSAGLGVSEGAVAIFVVFALLRYHGSAGNGVRQ